MKVLVVDDEEDIRRIATLSLSRVGGIEVIEASSGADGLSMAERERPDAILLDVMMPVLDGPATLQSLRQNPRTAGIPVVFLTAKAMPSEVERLKKLGSQGVLTKPFDPMTLSDDLRGVLKTNAGGTGVLDSLDQLRAHFLHGCSVRFSRMETCLARLERDGTDREALTDLRREFHGFSGLGGTCGFPRATELGLQGEASCDGAAAHARVRGEDVVTWRTLLAALRGVLEGPPDPASG